MYLNKSRQITTCANKVEGKISYTLLFVITTCGMGDEKGMIIYTLP